MMNRRQFLSRSASLGALGLSSGAALANGDTYQRFHAALAADASLQVYADVAGDQAGAASVLGRIPRELNGVLFRNGPGRFELGGERAHHWFDGDGFAQRWQIRDGRVGHLGKFVQTRRFVEESAAGRFLYPSFGTSVRRRVLDNNDTMNAANTNLLPLDGRLYALWEGGSAYEVDPATLATVGLKTWRGDLKAMPFSAHPKMDPDGGLWNFGALPGADLLAVYRLDARGQVLRTATIRVPKLAMVHDFVVSARQLIFLVPPYDLLPDPTLSFAERHVWAGAGPQGRALCALVVDKDTLRLRQVFELPARMVFHFGNAFDDGQTTRLDAVLHDGDMLGELGGLMRGQRPPRNGSRSALTQITLDYASGQAREARLFGDSEFPRVAPQAVSRRHRKLVVAGLAEAGVDRELNSVNLVDIDSGKVDGYAFGAGWQVEEHVLVPRRRARGETDGYLVGVAQDLRRGQTVLTVFDAARVAAGPMALARLPYRAPHCFHGNFLPA